MEEEDDDDDGNVVVVLRPIREIELAMTEAQRAIFFSATYLMIGFVYLYT